MDLEEIQMRLDQGVKPACPGCEYFTESEDCLIVMCDNPFVGPMYGEIEDHLEMIESFYKKSKCEVVKNER
jgi:hypothetical protein